MRRVLEFVLFGLCLFGVDFVSKLYVHEMLPIMGRASPFYPYGGIAVFHQLLGGIDFSINYVTNKGAAWGMLSSFQDYLLYFRFMIIGSVLVYLLFFAEYAQKFPLLLVLVGAAGNVVDYFVYGHVVDMFYFRLWGHSFPVFNIADSAIFCGIVWMLLQSLVKKKPCSE